MIKKRIRELGLAKLIYITVFVILFIILSLISYYNSEGPDKWWPAAFNLYLPQWIWALPSIILIMIGVRSGWKWIVGGIVTLLWVVGPIMGFCYSIKKPASTKLIRIMTYNVKWGRHDLHAIAAEVINDNADIILFQDANGKQKVTNLINSILSGRHIYIYDQYVVASRYPIISNKIIPITYNRDKFDIIRSVIRLPQKEITVYNVHLYTPRSGLTSVLYEGIDSTDNFQYNVQTRIYQAAVLSSQIRNETNPVIVAGDFNAPMQSIVCKYMLMCNLKDSFSESGTGYGYTYGAYLKLKHPFLRLDHIFIGKDWKSINCWVGNKTGSEHCPVITDLELD